MKKRIKKLLFSSLVAFVSIVINFNAEARLPKYMAKRAAELLIEKSELQLNSGVTKEAFATKLVDFLYTTEKRQHLANWMKNRIERGQVKRNAVTDAVGTVQHFTNLFNDIQGEYLDNYNFRTFVNQHFPCWTGTMTCFMLNSESHILLIQGNAVDLCRTKLRSTNNTYKIVSILFSLELIDNWNDIKQICKTEVEPDTSPRLDEPHFKDDDPYNCIPVPNTAYEVENIYNGTCLLSAARNLLCILRERDKDFKNLNIKVEVMEYLRRFESFPQLATVPGITNIDEQNRWAGTLLAIRNLHLPDLKGFIDTLIGLIKDTSDCREVFDLYERAELQKYRDNFNFGSGIQNGNKINPDILNPLITQILMHITSEKHKINAQIREATSIDKKTRTWPTLILEIFDYTIKKAIFIGIGNVSRGQHIEILDIKPIS